MQECQGLETLIYMMAEYSEIEGMLENLSSDSLTL